jgi:hypothetical protein
VRVISRLSNATAWLCAGTIFLVTVAWTNLTGLHIGAYPLTYDDVALPRFAIAIVGASLVWLLLAITLSRGNALLWDSTWLLLAALAGWSVVSAAVSGSALGWLGQSERLEGVATMVLYAALFGAGLQLGTSARFVRRLAVAFSAGAVLLTCHGLTQYLRIDPTNYLTGYRGFLGKAFASLGNPNFLAGLLVLALPVVAGLALTSSRRAMKVAWWASAALMLVAVYATASQGAWAAGSVEIGLAVGLWAWSRRRQAGGASSEARAGAWRVALLVVLVVCIGIAAIAGASAIAGRRWGPSLSESGSARVMLAETALGAAASRPLFGFGPDNFLAAFRLHRPGRYAATFGDESTNANAHSWPVQFAATLGFPGALLLGVALVVGLMRARPRRAESAMARADLLAAAVWIGAVGFLVQMLFDVAMLASTLPFWALLGAVCSAKARPVEVPKLAALAAAAVCAVLLVGSVVAADRLLVADADFMRSRLAYNGFVQGDAVELARSAARLNPLSIKYARAVAQSRSQLVYAALENPAASAGTVRALYADADADFRRTLSLAPADYTALCWLAALQTTVGTRLADPALLASGRETAVRAAALDLTHWEVAPLARGDTSASAVGFARAAPALP